MKKNELERLRTEFANTRTFSTDQLRAKVSRDLNIIKDSYDIGAQAILELGKMISLNSGGLDPKALSHLAKAYADISRTLIALRDEGRTTIREASATQPTGGPADADPPEPAGERLAPPLSDSPKILSPRATPVALGEYLNTLNSGDLDPPEKS